MTPTPHDPPRPVSRTVKIGAALFTACVIASLWLGDWRLATTGVVVLLALAVVTSGADE